MCLNFDKDFPLVEGVVEPVTQESREFRGSTHGSETILLVEDREGLCTLLTNVLRSNGYTVFSSTNGREAFKVIRENPYIDLVITDMVMPQMGGRQRAELLRPLQPQTKILCMSGYTDREEDVRELLSNGHAFIEKPALENHTGEFLSRRRDRLCPRSDRNEAHYVGLGSTR